MSGVSLPPVAAPVLVAAVDGLPARLRKKVDEAVTRFAALPVVHADGTYTVTVDDATVVTLTPDGGVVRTAEAATCTCLLAPNCLHRAAVLACAPVDDGLAPGAAGQPQEPGAGTAGTAPAETAEAGTATAGTGPGTDFRADSAVAGPADAGAGAGASTGETQPGTTGTAASSADEHARASRGGESSVDSRAGADAVDEPLSVPQRAAVEQLWHAAVDVLAAGVTGSGTVARAGLLRAAHEAQACKVYRPAAAARVVANLLQAARTGDPGFRLADLTEALQELLGVLHRLREAGDGGPAEGLLGSARRSYALQGSLRLHGLCTTAVLSDTGYAGVVTYAADRDGRLWMVADLMPGDARRAAAAGNATVALGETALSHRGLTRAGLVVSGATASSTRQLGAGKSVRAVTAAGCGWHEEPLAKLWASPLADQVHRAFSALVLPITDRRAGDDLVFVSVRVEGTDGDAVHATAADGTPLTLRVADDDPALGYRDNLRLIGRTQGLEMLVVARPDPARQATVLPLAVAPTAGVRWSLPASHDGHVDLAYDRLHRSHLLLAGAPEHEPATGARQHEPPTAAEQPEPASGAKEHESPTGADRGTTAPAGVEQHNKPQQHQRPAVGNPMLRLLRAQVERTVSGGRTVLTFSGGRGPSDATRLRRARLDTGAVLLDRLTTVATVRPRDGFGRLAGDDGSAFAQAWLATAVYSDAAGRAVAEATWLPGNPGLEASA